MNTAALTVIGMVGALVGVVGALISGNYIAAFWALASAGWALLAWVLDKKRRGIW